MGICLCDVQKMYGNGWVVMVFFDVFRFIVYFSF